MQEIESEKMDMAILLVHYFVTKENYKPIIIHGISDEYWLENLENDYKIIRIVTSHIHNGYQLNYNLLRAKKIMSKVKFKTLSFKLKSLNFFIDLGDNVSVEPKYDTYECFELEQITDLKKYDILKKNFPGVLKLTPPKQSGFYLFYDLTQEIGEKNFMDAKRADEVFEYKKPVITYIIIAINIIMYLITAIMSGNIININSNVLYNFGALLKTSVLNGEVYRILTAAFLHGGIFHLFFNMYALYIIGPQLEGFLGKAKFSIVYLYSIIIGSLMSLLFTNGLSIGASGAIFGLLGSLLYFGYHYRIYLGNFIHSQIIPIIIINLILGFMISNVDVAAHIGGLIGGLLITTALGIKYKSSKIEMINGWIVTIILTLFLIFILFRGF